VKGGEWRDEKGVSSDAEEGGGGRWHTGERISTTSAKLQWMGKGRGATGRRGRESSERPALEEVQRVEKGVKHRPIGSLMCQKEGRGNMRRWKKKLNTTLPYYYGM